MVRRAQLPFLLRLLTNGLAVPCLFALFIPVVAGQEAFSKEQLDFFESKIRPVLVEQCYECHSAEASKTGKLKGELFLDSRVALLKGGESGPAVVPGKPDKSLLISALHYDEYEMPPKGKLPAAVIADFEQWITMGAADPRTGTTISTVRKLDFDQGRKFWSFQPLRAAPKELQENPHLNPVDFFVQKKHADLGLRLAPFASPRILVRRAWFDLLGIPPQPAELEHWTRRLGETTSNESPFNFNVWSELIDHLLTRPEYGERWARHWMDVARFGESFGYEQDYDRPNAYHYRDFLIKAFNSDLPYDQFVQWQIAGDQIEPQEPLAWMATGFLGGGVFPTQLTETEFEKTRYDELDDMVATTGVAFLGLSIGCARCHDHKFDPLASEDYYRMAATFERTIRAEKTFDLDPIENERRQKEFTTRLQAARDELAMYSATELPIEFRKWLSLEKSPKTGAKWQVLVGDITSSAQTSYRRLDDGSYLAQGQAPNQEVVTFVAALDGPFKSLRIEALADGSLPNLGPGRAPNGNFALCKVNVSLLGNDGTSKTLQLISPRATFEQDQNSLGVASALDDNAVSGWAVDGQIGRDQAAVFDIDSPPTIGVDARIRVELTFSHPNPRHAIGRLRVSMTDSPAAVAEVGDVGPPEKVRRALANLLALSAVGREVAERDNSSDWQQGFDWFKSQSLPHLTLLNKVAEIEKAGAGIQLTKVLVSSEGLPHLPHHADDRGYPHFYKETHLLRRGDVTQKVSVVTPGFPQVLRKFPSSPLNRDSVAGDVMNSRQELAEWLTDVELGAGPLVARVMVNRLWQYHFGKGIVASPNDFGEMGDRPTNPDLLDWLGQELIGKSWHLKPLHKVIMTSHTYLQGNKSADDAQSQIDPDNEFLWHRAPKRLEAEAIRDSMLVVSGQLDSKMYGPGTLDANMKRRSVYFFIKRSQLIPSLMLFDWPEHLVSIGQRQSTTVAPQALMFMNSQQGRSYAESFARRISSDDDEVTVAAAYSVAFGRKPTLAETRVGLEFLTRNKELRTKNGEADAGLFAVADLCQTLMSMNEFIYID